MKALSNFYNFRQAKCFIELYHRIVDIIRFIIHGLSKIYLALLPLYYKVLKNIQDINYM